MTPEQLQKKFKQANAARQRAYERRLQKMEDKKREIELVRS